MSLSSLAWRYVGAGSFGTASVAAALDALYTLGTATTYADGSGRTPGSGSAWTWSRYQNASVTEAAYATPPTDTLAQRIILAGQATGGTKTPTMASPDASAVNIVMASVNKNSGAFNAWDNAAPFTSGQFFGFWRCWPTTAGTGTVYLYEGTEAVLVLIATTGGSVYGCILGAFLDPESSDVANDAESDGKLYGVVTTGSAAAMGTGFLSGGAVWMFHSGSASAVHAGIFTPGAGSLLTMGLLLRAQTAMTSSGLKTRSGRFARHALAMRADAAAPNDQFLGRLREIFAFTDAQTPQKQTNGGSTIGYVVSASTSSTADSLLLGHA